VAAGTLLRAHLTDAIVHAGGAKNARAFFHGEGERLLHVDVLAGVQRVNGDGRVPVVRRGDDHRIQPRHLEHLAVIREQLRARRQRLRLLGARAIDVADGRQRGVVQLLEMGQKQIAARAAADERHGHAVIRSQDAGLRGGGNGRGPGCGE
jgi:hypothetical protein